MSQNIQKYSKSIGPMLHVNFKRWPCRRVKFRGQGPHSQSQLIETSGHSWKLLCFLSTARVCLHFTSAHFFFFTFSIFFLFFSVFSTSFLYREQNYIFNKNDFAASRLPTSMATRWTGNNFFLKVALFDRATTLDVLMNQ